ncbi:MAG: hypothetical protein LBC27_09550 [Spirochaetaceae bacterium]|nr:hypothetical protein [Spirochaetaceae bacterium]
MKNISMGTNRFTPVGVCGNLLVAKETGAEIVKTGLRSKLWRKARFLPATGRQKYVQNEKAW